MEYTIKTAEVLGDMVFLRQVAVAMAKRLAGAGNMGFHQQAYDAKYRRFCGHLIEEARAGRLVVCNRHGEHGALDDIMAESERAGELVSNPQDANETVVLNVCTYIRQLNIWADARGDTFAVAHEMSWIDERGWVNGETVLDALQPVQLQLPKLMTSDVAHVFAGLRQWDEARWKKALGDKPAWLKECVAEAGQRGVVETRWNPVLIGAALINKGVMAKSVRARFQIEHLLQPWLEVWKDYEAEHFPMD